MPEIYKVFVGGGGDDWFTHIVKRYEKRYEELNPAYKCLYASWTQQSDVSLLLRVLPQDAHVTLVGHSYGGDAAFSAVTSRAVNVLITIDPVGWLRPSWAKIRAGAQLWLNIRAEPDEEHSTNDEYIAAVGGKYPPPPAPGQPYAPNFAGVANTTHGDFWRMMRTRAGGTSGATLLGGRHAA